MRQRTPGLGLQSVALIPPFPKSVLCVDLLWAGRPSSPPKHAGCPLHPLNVAGSVSLLRSGRGGRVDDPSCGGGLFECGYVFGFGVPWRSAADLRRPEGRELTPRAELHHPPGWQHHRRAGQSQLGCLRVAEEIVAPVDAGAFEDLSLSQAALDKRVRFLAAEL